jgi:cytosine/adenosine deaminase-related metal-dependent hydrolase
MPSTEIIHRAGWVIADAHTCLPNGFLRERDGVIQEIGSGRATSTAKVIDHGEGVLMPMPVNAHTHLELGALAGAVPCDQGFLPWVQQLLAKRQALETRAIEEGIHSGIRALWASGCGVIGEIASLDVSWPWLAASPMAGVYFREHLGSAVRYEPEKVDARGRMPQSLAGHAPHTTAPRLLSALKQTTRQAGLPFSLHLAESVEEMEFLRTGRGIWADFLASRDIDFAMWERPRDSLAGWLDQLALLDERTLAVHCLHCDQSDFERLQQKGASVCVCVRSNRNLHGRMPDMAAIQASGVNVCLGTDSLASTASLSIFDEMQAVAEAYPFLRPHQILEMATDNGARALGLETHYGGLSPGRQAAMAYIPVKADSADHLLAKLVNGDIDSSQLCWRDRRLDAQSVSWEHANRLKLN